jgi:hypothetical protein
MIYALTDLPSGRLTYEEMPQHNIEQFCKARVKIFYFNLFFDQMWKKDGSFDITIAQKQIRGVLDVCPDASVFIRLHMHTPAWWLDTNPDEAVKYGDGPAIGDIAGRFMRSQHNDPIKPHRYSLASALWKKEITEKTTLFCKKLSQAPEGNAVSGIQVAGGVYGEWHYWGGESDFSQPMTSHFRGWLKNKYKTNDGLKKAWNRKEITFQTAQVPSVRERQNSDEGIFRSPVSERNLIDYYECQHQLVADHIIHFCKTVKESWPRKIIAGTFYGYFFSLFGRETAIGHLEVRRVLNSPFVDYLSAPQAYYPDAHEVGFPSRPRGLPLSCLLNGKLWLDEYDTQADLTKTTDAGADSSSQVYKKAMQSAVGITRRNILSSATTGTGLWFFDFGVAGGRQYAEAKDNGANGWWDFPPILNDIKQLKIALEKNRLQEYKSDADVLMVYDTKVFYHLATRNKLTSISNVAVNWSSLAAWSSGVGLDAIYIEDLEKVNLKQYRTIIFNNTFLLNEQQKKLIKEKVCKEQRQIIWFYAPGYADGKSLNIKNISDVTGMPMEKFQPDKPVGITVTGLTDKEFSYSISDTVLSPLFSVSNKGVTSLGVYSGTNKIAIAKKQMKDYTSWYVAVPSYGNELVKALIKNTGAHIYNDSGDIFYVGDGLIGIHTKHGGNKTIKFKNGKQVQVAFPEGSSTTILDSETGDYILRPEL